MDHAKLKEVLNYHPTTGDFAWKITSGKSRKGSPAGYISKRGYVQIGLEGKIYLAHRLAWFYVTGVWPTKNVDHIDGNPTNNAIENLRLASQSENIRNSRLSKSNTSGHKGVCWDSKHGRWLAYLKLNYKHVLFKLYDSFDDAVAAVDSARQKYHGQFANYG
jgi:hypothetical protein